MSSEQGLMVKGDLVFATVSSVREKSYGILENYHKNEFVVDCSDMSRIDSAGIALMLEWKQWCNENKKKCHLKGLQAQGVSLIETYTLGDLLTVS